MGQFKQVNIVTRLFIIVMLVHFTRGYSIQEVDKLITDKLANHNKNLRPVVNQSLPINVTVGLELILVKEFEEVSEKITIVAVHQLLWFDENFKWDPKHHGGIDTVTINESEVWKPTLILVNTFDKLEEIGGSGFVVRINSSGSVEWYPGSVLSAACQVDSTYYPFDTQKCKFQLLSWAFLSREIQLHLLTDVVSTNYYTPSGVWDLVSSSCFREYETMLVFNLVLKRKPVFIFVNVILPIIFMSCLNLIAFLIPSESGERMSYSITVLLSIAVFLTIVGDNLPKTSNPMSILSYYLVSVLGMSVCITLATIFSLRIYFRDEREHLSPIWRRFVRLFRCSSVRNNRRKMARERRVNEHLSGHRDRRRRRPHEEIYRKSNYITTSSYPDRRYRRNKGQIYKLQLGELNGGSHDDFPSRHLNTNMTMPADDDEPEQQVTASVIDEMSWKDVSVAVDNLCFIVFLILYVICSTWSLVSMIWNV